MSTLKQPQAEDHSLAEIDIAEYLLGHPDFFERHLSLLGNLRLPHRTGNAAVSLVEKQVSVLRQTNLTLERKLRDLVNVAQGNDQLAGKIHALSLALLQTNSREEIVALLERELRTSFKADRTTLVLFTDTDALTGDGFLRCIERNDECLAPFRTFFDANKPRCGRVRDAQRNFLFGNDDIEVGSVALLPLGESVELGFLAIGSRDAEHFHPGMSIDFLSRLGELVSCALRR
jgi:uncharacterized protein YigA (DUF484 family)